MCTGRRENFTLNGSAAIAQHTSRLNLLYDKLIVKPRFKSPKLIFDLMALSVGEQISAGKLPFTTSKDMSNNAVWSLFTVVIKGILTPCSMLCPFGLCSMLCPFGLSPNLRESC